MKKEAIIAVAISLLVGFLAGYVTDAQMNWNARHKAAQTAAAPSDMLSGAAAAPEREAMPPPGLPEGHPPIDAASVIQQMERMAARNPGDVDVRLKLADFLYDQKQYSRAIEWYQRALELDPKNVDARTDLGTALFYSGRPQDALREYDKTLETDPRHESTLINMVVVSVEGTHDLAAAQKAWDRLYKLNPNHAALAGLKEKIDAARISGGAPRPQ